MGKNKNKGKAKTNSSASTRDNPAACGTTSSSRPNSHTGLSSSSATRSSTPNLRLVDGTSEQSRTLSAAPLEGAKAPGPTKQREAGFSLGNWLGVKSDNPTQKPVYRPHWQRKLWRWWPCRAYRSTRDVFAAFIRALGGHQARDVVMTMALLAASVFAGYVAIELSLRLFKGVAAQDLALDGNCSIVYVTVPGPVITVSLVAASPSDPAHATYYFSVINGTTEWLNSITPPSQFMSLPTRTPDMTAVISSLPVTLTSLPSAPVVPSTAPPSLPMSTPFGLTTTITTTYLSGATLVTTIITSVTIGSSLLPSQSSPASAGLPTSGVPSLSSAGSVVGPSRPWPSPFVPLSTLISSTDLSTTAASSGLPGQTPPGVTSIASISPPASVPRPSSSGLISSMSSALPSSSLAGSSSSAALSMSSLVSTPTGIVSGGQTSILTSTFATTVATRSPSFSPIQATTLSTLITLTYYIPNGPTSTITSLVTTVISGSTLLGTSTPALSTTSSSLTTPISAAPSGSPTTVSGGSITAPTAPSTSVPGTSSLSINSSSSPTRSGSSSVPSTSLSVPTASIGSTTATSSVSLGPSSPSVTIATTTRTASGLTTITTLVPTASVTTPSGSSIMSSSTAPSSSLSTSSSTSSVVIPSSSAQPPAVSSTSSSTSTPSVPSLPSNSPARNLTSSSTLVSSTTSSSSPTSGPAGGTPTSAPSIIFSTLVPPTNITSSSSSRLIRTSLSSSISSGTATSSNSPNFTVSSSPGSSGVNSLRTSTVVSSTSGSLSSFSVTTNVQTSTLTSFIAPPAVTTTVMPGNSTVQTSSLNTTSSMFLARGLMTKVISYGDTAVSFVFPTPNISTTVSYWTGVYPTVTGPEPSDLQTISPTTRSIRQTPLSALPSFSLFSSKSRSFKTVVTTIYDDDGPEKRTVKRAAAPQIPETFLPTTLQDPAPTPTGTSDADLPGPTSCGESGNFTLNFDDTVVGPTVDLLPVVNGLASPYHHLFYANGYTYVPDRWEPYPSISQPNIAMFLPLAGRLLPSRPFVGTLLPGEIGAGPRASVSAYWFNAYSGYFGCALSGLTPCNLRISGYRYDSALKEEVLAVEQSVTLPACWGYIDCQLTQVSFNDQFRALSGIQFNAYTAGLGIPQVHMMDDLQMEWYNNTCSAGILRIGHR